MLSEQEWEEYYLKIVSDPRFKLFGMTREELLRFREIKMKFLVTAQDIHDIVQRTVMTGKVEMAQAVAVTPSAQMKGLEP